MEALVCFELIWKIHCLEGPVVEGLAGAGAWSDSSLSFLRVASPRKRDFTTMQPRHSLLICFVSCSLTLLMSSCCCNQIMWICVTFVLKSAKIDPNTTLFSTEHKFEGIFAYFFHKVIVQFSIKLNPFLFH